MGFSQDAPAVYLTYWPDWNEGIKVSYAWKTGVLSTISFGKEQRSMYRSKFTRKMQFDLTNLSYAESNRVLRNMQRYASSPWGVPLFTDAIQLTATSAIGSTTLTLSPRLASLNFVDDDQLILLDPDNNPTTYEIATIDAIGADSITLTSGLVAQWASGKWVCPLIRGFVSKEDILFLTSEYSSLKLTVTQLETGVATTE